MGYSPADLEAIAKKLRMDLTNAQGKLTALQNGIAELAVKLPAEGDGFRCPDPHCGLKLSSEARVQEHQENVHGLIVL